MPVRWSIACIVLTSGGDASSLHQHDSLYVRIGVGTQSTLLGVSAYATNRIGIGTSSPATDLEFGGFIPRTISVQRNPLGDTGGNSLALIAGGASPSSTDKDGGRLVLSSGTSTGTKGSEIHFNTASGSITGSTDNTPSTKMVITQSGNVAMKAL